MNLPKIPALNIGDNEEIIGRFVSFAAPIGALAVSAAIIIFIVWPRFIQILKLKDDNQKLSERVQNLNAKAQVLASLDKDLLIRELDVVEQLLPSDKGVFPLVTQIETTAASSGILLSKIDVAPGSFSESSAKTQPHAAAPSSQEAAAADAGASKVQLRLSLSGDYKSFLQFLNNVYSIARVVSLKELSLSSSSAASGQSSQVRASVSVDAYWSSLPTELNSIEAPVEDLAEKEAARLEQVRTTGFIAPPAIPKVPVGRGDLFAPF